MPAKAPSFTNRRLIEGIFKEGIDRHASSGLTPASERSTLAAIG
ncbi:hypothetical protein EV12_0797 [Prochlorococcus sp. MIT 0701]|nr:hypothetical protein EV12_0797 [Prochlorococcus sp. MIT 0701]